MTLPKVTGSKDTEIVARCHRCKRTDIPLDQMAAYSFKALFGGLAGVCKHCIANPPQRENQFR